MKDVSAVYDKVLDDFRNMRGKRIKRQVRNVTDLLGLSGGERILEIGIATGKYTSIMSRGNTVYGVDISLENLKRGRKAVEEMGNNENLFCVNADCSRLPFKDRVFDKVAAIDVIEHLTDEVFASLCKEAYRVAKAGASFCIYTPNLLHPYELARPFRPVLRKEHIGVRTRSKICRYLRDAGFGISKSGFNNFYRRISIKAQKYLSTKA
jgi:ubiquinone/menaquinone biosynthesis C-methylase UbiE